MVATPKGLADNSPMDVGMLDNLENPSIRNSPTQFSELLDVK